MDWIKKMGRSMANLGGSFLVRPATEEEVTAAETIGKAARQKTERTARMKSERDASAAPSLPSGGYAGSPLAKEARSVSRHKRRWTIWTGRPRRPRHALLRSATS